MNTLGTLNVRPAVTQADEPLTNLNITGLPPHAEATLRAAATDESGTQWIAHGTYRSDASGAIDVATDTPLYGTFSRPDPSALLWSMRPEGNNSTPVPLFKKESLTALPIAFTLEVNGETTAQTTVERTFCPTDVIRTPVEQDGMAGTLFHPAGDGPYPTIICLSGSGGGFSETRAALIAAHGYAALALAYFQAGSLPKELSEIPLEFFERGLAWLKQHPCANLEQLAVYGYSKGGELALLLASRYPQIKAVAAFSASSFVWQGLRFGRPASSWTHQDTPLPFIPMKVPFKTMVQLMTGKPVAFRESYARGILKTKILDAATIPVEQINGPVFLVAGTNDQVWPAADFADRVIERLKQHQHPHPHTYFREQDAGHLTGMPYLPSAEIFNNLIFSTSHAEQTSLAMIKTWHAMINFFERTFRLMNK